MRRQSIKINTNKNSFCQQNYKTGPYRGSRKSERAINLVHKVEICAPSNQVPSSPLFSHIFFFSFHFISTSSAALSLSAPIPSSLIQTPPTIYIYPFCELRFLELNANDERSVAFILLLRSSLRVRFQIRTLFNSVIRVLEVSSF